MKSFSYNLVSKSGEQIWSDGRFNFSTQKGMHAGRNFWNPVRQIESMSDAIKRDAFLRKAAAQIPGVRWVAGPEVEFTAI